MPTCPNGHQSGTDDWCEVCGMRIAVPSSSYGTRPPSASASASASASSSPVSTSPGVSSRAAYDPDATAMAELCPQCRTPREGAALFCEECRYNFRTQTATTFVAPPAPATAAPGFAPYTPDYSQRSRPSQVNRPAEPVPEQSVTSGSGDFLLDPPSSQVRSASAAEAPAAPDVRRPAEGGAPEHPSVYSPSPGPAPRAPAVQQGAPQQHAGASERSVPSSGPSAGPSAGLPGGSPAGPGVGFGGERSGGQAPGAGTAWVAVIAADRAYFTAMMARSGPEAGGLYFPTYSPEIQLPLIGNQITIGRRRQSTGEAPDIDLGRAPEDPGVSHQHAVLVQQPDGTWAVVDQDSTNGTTVNLGEDTIPPYTPIPLAEGDRVHVGAWTTITLRRA
jgi:hypothetical protein